MFCTKCGAELNEEACFCEMCGATVEKPEEEKVEVKPNISNIQIYHEIDISEGQEWRWRWAGYLNSIIRMAYIKVVLLWLVIMSLSMTFLKESLFGGISSSDTDAIFGVSMIVIVIVLVAVSYVIIENAKNKVARERVMLQQATDIRYLAEYVKEKNWQEHK